MEKIYLTGATFVVYTVLSGGDIATGLFMAGFVFFFAVILGG